MFGRYVVFSFLLSFIAGSADAAPSDVHEKLKKFGFRLSDSSCKTVSANEGAGKELTFIEIKLDCPDFNVVIELTNPIVEKNIDPLVANDERLVESRYAAKKNPYAGYVSTTISCSLSDNFWKEKYKFGGRDKPLIIGRVSGRGGWGACGKERIDFWRAQTYLEHRNSLVKVTASSKTKRKKDDFRKSFLGFLEKVTAE